MAEGTQTQVVLVTNMSGGLDIIKCEGDPAVIRQLFELLDVENAKTATTRQL